MEFMQKVNLTVRKQRENDVNEFECAEIIAKITCDSFITHTDSNKNLDIIVYNDYKEVFRFTAKSIFITDFNRDCIKKATILI